MTSAQHDITLPARPVWPALKRGMACRCPACGQGRLYRAYLKVNDECPVCHEALYHQRADDMPPYVTMVIVGHFVVAGVIAGQDLFPNMPDWPQMIFWPIVALLMSLALLPGVKGALIAYQWALRMHGFGARRPADPDFAGESL
jgi:uncharacterized protein (DUF983 family)